jgi:hypothetical protein
VEAFLAVVGHFLILGLRHFGIASEDVLSEVSFVLFFGDISLEPAELVQGVPADDGPLLEGRRPVFIRPEVVAHLEQRFDPLPFLVVVTGKRVVGVGVGSSALLLLFVALLGRFLLLLGRRRGGFSAAAGGSRAVSIGSCVVLFLTAAAGTAARRRLLRSALLLLAASKKNKIVIVNSTFLFFRLQFLAIFEIWRKLTGSVRKYSE